MVIIGGPTNSGKTGLALKIAKETNSEIISADSRQIYKYMDIGTGKKPIYSDVPYEAHDDYWIMDGVKIWGYDIVTPDVLYSAGDFYEFFLKTQKKILESGKNILLVGGTGFYIDTVLRGGIAIHTERNSELRKELNSKNATELRSMLPNELVESLNDSEKQNKQRLIRKIEIFKAHGAIPHENILDISGHLFINLTGPRELIYQKADLWVDTIWQKLKMETIDLTKRGYEDSHLMNGIVYSTCKNFLDKKLTETEAIQMTKYDIHAYIRRQLIWFKRYGQYSDFIDISVKNFDNDVLMQVKSYIEKHGR